MSSVEEIVSIREAHRFDEKGLADYLKGKLEGFSGRMTVCQFRYGQSNPTFLLSTADREYVLRKKPPGKLLPSAHAVDREYRIIKALGETDAPVPKAYLLCEDDSIIGTAFYVMERVEGRISRHPTAPEASGAGERAAIFDAMNDTLARIHRVDWKALGLDDYGKSGNYMARQLGRWARQYEAAKTDEIESMDHLIRWLSDHIPSDDTTSIVHGDYRLENMIVHPTEPRVVAVLDWEISTLGVRWLIWPIIVWAIICPRRGGSVSATRGSISRIGGFRPKRSTSTLIAAGPAGLISPTGSSSSFLRTTHLHAMTTGNVASHPLRASTESVHVRER